MQYLGGLGSVLPFAARVPKGIWAPSGLPFTVLRTESRIGRSLRGARVRDTQEANQSGHLAIFFLDWRARALPTFTAAAAQSFNHR